MKDYLVFVQDDPPQYGGPTDHASLRPARRFNEDASELVMPYGTAYAVRAKDENSAAIAVTRHTRRLAKTAVIPAVFFDPSKGEDSEPDSRPLLNP